MGPHKQSSPPRRGRIKRNNLRLRLPARRQTYVPCVANRLRFGCESQDTRRCLLFPVISSYCLLLPALLAIAFTVAWGSLGKLLSIQGQSFTP
jgi:hypothetical protein